MTTFLSNRDIYTSFVCGVVPQAKDRLWIATAGIKDMYVGAGGRDMVPEVRPGVRCPTGEARITPGFKLPAKFVIHTVGPVYRDGQHGEPEKLAACYRNSLALAAENGCKSIAFPCISTGIYGFPKEASAKIAVREVEEFLFPTKTQRRREEELEVIFCCFTERDKEVYERLLLKLNLCTAK